MLAAMAATGAIVRNWGEPDAIPALVGLAAAACYAYGFARASRWKWLVAAVLALSAVALASVPSPQVEPWADPSHLTGLFPAALVGRYIFMSICFGLKLLLSGGITLAQYVRNTQPPALEIE
jgi:hypothetical protein